MEYESGQETGSPSCIIRINYETWTPEAMEAGDTDDRGEYEEIELDEDDTDEDTTLAQAIVHQLGSSGITEPSASFYHSGLWYSSADPERDYQTGGETTYTAHLETDEGTAREVYRLITGKPDTNDPRQ